MISTFFECKLKKLKTKQKYTQRMFIKLHWLKTHEYKPKENIFCWVQS